LGPILLAASPILFSLVTRDPFTVLATMLVAAGGAVGLLQTPEPAGQWVMASVLCAAALVLVAHGFQMRRAREQLSTFADQLDEQRIASRALRSALEREIIGSVGSPYSFPKAQESAATLEAIAAVDGTIDMSAQAGGGHIADRGRSKGRYQ
jgi:hypothetical protein